MELNLKMWPSDVSWSGAGPLNWEGRGCTEALDASFVLIACTFSRFFTPPPPFTKQLFKWLPTYECKHQAADLFTDIDVRNGCLQPSVRAPAAGLGQLIVDVPAGHQVQGANRTDVV